jgi:hypothetical protein
MEQHFQREIGKIIGGKVDFMTLALLARFGMFRIPNRTLALLARFGMFRIPNMTLALLARFKRTPPCG